MVSDQRDITEGLIKEVNALLLTGVGYTMAQNQQGQKVKKKANPGQYKMQPNHVVQVDGSIHWYVEPLHVPEQMAELVNWVSCQLDVQHPIIVAAMAHYHLVRIHPFDDGNGRGARILMNLILLKKGYFPAVLSSEKKRFYLNALAAADAGNATMFVEFVAAELLATMETVVADFQSGGA